MKRKADTYKNNLPKKKYPLIPFTSNQFETTNFFYQNGNMIIQYDPTEEILAALKNKKKMNQVTLDRINPWINKASGEEKSRHIDRILESRCSAAIQTILKEIKQWVKEASAEEKSYRIERVLKSSCSAAIQTILKEIKQWVKEASDEEKSCRIERVLKSSRSAAIQTILKEIKQWVKEASAEEKSYRIERVLTSSCSAAIQAILKEIKQWVNEASAEEKSYRIERVLKSGSCSAAIQAILKEIKQWVKEASAEEKSYRIERVLKSGSCSAAIQAILKEIKQWVNEASAEEKRGRIEKVQKSRCTVAIEAINEHTPNCSQTPTTAGAPYNAGSLFPQGHSPRQPNSLYVNGFPRYPASYPWMGDSAYMLQPGNLTPNIGYPNEIIFNYNQGSNPSRFFNAPMPIVNQDTTPPGFPSGLNNEMDSYCYPNNNSMQTPVYPSVPESHSSNLNSHQGGNPSRFFNTPMSITNPDTNNFFSPPIIANQGSTPPDFSSGLLDLDSPGIGDFLFLPDF